MCLGVPWVFIYLNVRVKVVLVYTAYKPIQGVPGGKVNILGSHSIFYSKQKYLYEHVSYSERFPR